MSLLFDHAIQQFRTEDATLCTVDENDVATVDSPVPVESIVEFAGYHERLSHPEEEDWICIPLHGQSDAVVTSEYVGFVDHPLHGEIIVFERDGERDSIQLGAFGQTRLARRIRFWHSDFIPEEHPPGYDAPIDDAESPSNPVDPDALFSGFAEYVTAEKDATRQRNAERANRQSARLIYEEGGDAIPTVVSRGEDDGAYRFRVELPSALEDRRDGDWAFFVEQEFGIHEGNEVFLQSNDADPPEDFPVPMTITKIRGLSVWLDLDWGAVGQVGEVGATLSHSGDAFGVVGRLNPVPFDREGQAVERLADSDLGEVIAGTRPIRFTNGAAAQSSQFDEDLNQEQAMAVRFALLADDLFCIHGPPGTGKTRTLVEIIRRAAEADEAVLVCADSNQAVDNIVAGSSTSETADEGSLHAYGQHGRDEFVLDRLNTEQSRHPVIAKYDDVPETADVVAATNSSAATTNRSFDLVVLDEATQSTCTASAIPLTRGERVVLAGDHRQLPPYSGTEDPPDSSYGLSLFEHLYAEGGVYEGVGLQLTTQYRMHRDIAYFPNRAFYDRRLRNGRTVSPLDGKPVLEGYNIGGRVELVDYSRRNEAEARLVTHLVGDLLEQLPPDEVGVITPYAAQAIHLRDHLAAELANGNAVAVDTIDAFQGSERTAIVISLVRSNAEGEIGFLGRHEDGPRRLNVALTRAQRYCAVVGDWHTFRYDAENKCTDLYQGFYEHFVETGRLKNVEPEFIPVPSRAE